MQDLKKNGSVSLKIEDEGGLNPTRAENPVIHSEDIERLDQVENARIKIRYGAKTNWSNTKIARDIMQNFYDGNGHTLEGVDINIVKNNDGTYNVRISGDGHYDYSHLESLGNSTKADDSSNAGAFGEGTRIVAVNLLAKDTPSVKYACGDWAMTFGRSSNDLQTADMTQTLSKNPETLKGNYIEFQTKNEGLVREILNSKDYFYHPRNEDFRNLDFENDYFGFKLLPQGEKGNVYIVQRYETDGNVDNGLPGFSMIFKKMPDDEELVKIAGSGYKLGTGRDRVQLYNYQIADLIARYAKTMSDIELTQVISSLEDVWRATKGKKIDQNQLNLVGAFVREARSRSLGIDFNSQKYVWLDKNSTPEDFEMAELMGYKIANPVMKDTGMSSFESFSNGKKKPLTPTPEQEAKIHLLDEAVKILQENSDINSAKFITKPDTKKPTLIFDEGGCPNEAAEAITSNGEYLGHWVKLPSIEFGDFVQNLATWIHEISHKVGGDTSEAFSNRLIDIQKYITDVMINNPAALEKMQVLADLYAGKSTKPLQQFDTAAYTTNVQQKLNSPFKYEEYIEEVNTPKKEGVTLGRTTVKSFDNNKKLGDMLTKQTPTSLLKTIIHKIRDKKSNLVSQISDAVTNTKPKTFMYEKLPQTTTVTETLTLPATSEYTDKLFNLGEPVRFTIPDTGNMNPTRSEVPAIHPEDVSRLGKTEHARIEIVYGAKTNWSNDKIARDIMQNFYDGNGHTMEGVGIEIIPEADGSYRVRVTGDGHYDYSHLEALGDSTKDGDGANAGAFGEGTRIVAVNLLAKDTPSVKYACGDWTMTFGRSSDDIKTAHMTQTLSKNNTPVKGNYIEFKTSDKDLVKTILDAKDYFKHPYNKDFQNPTFENKYFAFKVDDNKDAKGNLYYVQRYETENGKISGGLKNLSIAFKRTTDDPELRKISGYYNLNSGRDRMAINNSQLYDLANYYGKTMSDEELTQAIASLEPVLTAKSTNDPKLLFETKDTSIAFARGLIEEARRRGLQIDFSDAKIVYVPDYNWRAGNILDEEIENYLKDNGYRFAYSDCRNVGMKSAQEVYDLEHKPHSLKPTNEEIQKLRILREALDLFAKNDRTGSIPDLSGKQEYVFNAKSSHNTPFHALVKDQKYDGLFIDRKALANADFMSLLSSSIAEMLKVHGNLKSAAYSYQLTDYIRSQLNTFITKPETAKQLKILENMYQQIDKK